MLKEFKVTFFSKKKNVISMQYEVDATSAKEAEHVAETFLKVDGCKRADFKVKPQVKAAA